MARPPKNNCDYFSHDHDMRNHKKVKALRSTFGITGYAVWSMILEYLTGCDGNVFPYDDIEFELMAGDFGVSVTEIRNILDYCIRLEMLFNKNGFINSDSLDERLVAVYQKRGRAKELSKKQQRINGKFASNNTDRTVVSVTEMPQSKVKESKVKESSKIHTSTDVDGSVVDPTFLITPRIEKFKEEVFRIGSEIYTPQMLQNFVEKWTEPTRAKRPKLKFEKEATWDTALRLKTWARNNYDKIPCFLSELIPIADKKKAFTDTLAPYVEKYSRDMLNAFYRHWTQPENRKNPNMLRWELEDFWDLPARLRSWEERQNKDPKTEEKYRIPR